MPSTFFGLTIASSGLSAFQAAVNTTANNISNVKTVGYSRQQAIFQAAEALRVNQRYGTAGSGVEVTGIRQVRDLYYDVKYWDSTSDLMLYDARLYYSQQIEDYLLDDDSMKGFTTILDDMFSALDTLKTAAGDMDKRQQVVSKAQNLVNFFRGVSNGFNKIQDACNQEISTQVANINAIGAKIATLNKQINIIELQGGYANELRDQRAVLVDELSGIVSVECTELPVPNTNYPDVYLGGTDYIVKINGQTLVSSDQYHELKCVARDYKVNQSDSDGLYDIYWKETDIPLAAVTGVSSGSLRGLLEMRDGNNRENFTAKVSEAYRTQEGKTHLKLTGASIKDIKMMTMNDEGIINVGNTELKYTGFTYDADTDTYTFELEETLTILEQNKLTGKKAEIGTSIDAMGVPYYMAQMNMFLRSFCQEFNNLQRKGMDANGKDAGSFFVAVNPTDKSEYTFENYDETGSMNSRWDTYYRLTATNFDVSTDVVRNPERIAAVYQDTYNPDDKDKYDLIEDMLKLKSDTVLFRGGGASEFLKCLISDNSVDTQKAETFRKNYENLNNVIHTRRMSISGVDEDDEAMDMLKFQNAYNLAARMIQTMSEMYDRLILETGV